MEFLAWLLSIFFAFTLGAESATPPKESDQALREKVQGHIDVIVDESAALVDDVTESIRSDERVQQAEQAVKDVKEIADETLSDLTQVAEDVKTRVEEKFCPQDQIDGAPELPEGAVPEAPSETPAPGDPING